MAKSALIDIYTMYFLTFYTSADRRHSTAATVLSTQLRHLKAEEFCDVHQ